MKVTYTLSWEEYAELFEDSWPRTDYFSLIVTAMIAAPLIGYGITLAIFGAPDEKILYSMFIGAPMFLVIATIFATKSQTRQARKRAVTEKRRQYDRRQATEQSFSFNHEKWMHETDAGKQESPWSALTHAAELRNVFTLTGDAISIIVPKRSLDAASLESLRRAAIPIRGNGWPFHITWWDYQASATAMLWRKMWFRMAFANVFGIFVLGWVGQSWLTSNEKAGVVWGWILASLAVLLTLTAQLWYMPLRYFTSARNWRTPRKVELSERGIVVITPTGNYFTAWKAFHKFQELGRAYLIYTDESHYHLLSKHYFSPDQQAELASLLKANVRQEECTPVKSPSL
jgi:hypothetical protein